MKKLVYLGLLLSTTVNSAPVTSTGYGEDFNSAVTAAKIAALEQATGTWIDSEHFLKDGKTRESIVQYNGGVIKSYKVISYINNEATIEADVDVVKDNRVGTRSSSIPPDVRLSLLQKQEKAQQINSSVKFLDDRNKAFIFTPSNIEYSTRGDTTIVSVVGVLSYTPKWISDVRSLGQTINESPLVKTNTQDRVATSGVYSILNANPLLGGMAASIYASNKQEYIEKRTEPVVCFAESSKSIPDECFVINSEFVNFYPKMKLQVHGDSGNRSVLNIPVYLNENTQDDFYGRIYPGETRKNRWGYSVTYRNPGIVIYKDNRTQIKFNLTVPTETLASVDKFEFIVE